MVQLKLQINSMFSGIIESVGKVQSLEKSGTNLKIRVNCPFLDELKVDQSVAHNGVCLTVVDISDVGYAVDVISESLDRSNLGKLEIGHKINLERSVSLNDRLDGHMVQGHVDQTAMLEKVDNLDGSWNFNFKFNGPQRHVLIDKGSICVNGVSLTVSGMSDEGFQVSIIPYTYDYTNFGDLNVGDFVNIEFDVIGKYVEKLVQT